MSEKNPPAAPPPKPPTAKKSPALPTLLYRCPGQHNAGRLGTYDSKPATDQEELENMLEEGWSETLPEAADLYRKSKGK